MNIKFDKYREEIASKKGKYKELFKVDEFKIDNEIKRLQIELKGENINFYLQIIFILLLFLSQTIYDSLKDIAIKYNFHATVPAIVSIIYIALISIGLVLWIKRQDTKKKDHLYSIEALKELKTDINKNR